MEILGDIWNGAIIRPMVNSLVLLYAIFFSNFGLAILLFTVVVRAAMVPLTIRQSRSMKAMSSLQPKMKAVQEKYKNDRQRLSQETMKLYKAHGISPIGCLGPLVLQMPIFLGLFWALRATLPSTPEKLAELSQHLYGWLPLVHQTVPLSGDFLWLDLAKFSSDNPVPFLLPILVGVSMFVMQKMTSMPTTSPQQESTNRMMLWLMPGMFGVFTLSFEAGLALYWIASNIMGIVIQGFVTGWEPISEMASGIGRLFRRKEFEQIDESEPEEILPNESKAQEADIDEDDRNVRENSRRSNRNRSNRSRRRPHGRRNRGN